jgi:mRNA-degrading endonuclease YafQ of YafQ-DinJ toxin-antitoxin module
LRLFELLSEPLSVVASRRFIKDFALFSKTHKIEDKVSAFIEFRKTAEPSDGFNAKDYAFSNGHLRGFRHVHLVHGSVIVVYQIADGELRLCTITTHKNIDGIPPTSFISFLTGLESDDYEPFSLDDDMPSLTPKQKDEIIALMYDYAASHPQLLLAFLKGTDGEFMLLARMLVDVPRTNDEIDAAIHAAFGGEDEFHHKIRTVLQQVTGTR